MPKHDNSSITFLFLIFHLSSLYHCNSTEQHLFLSNEEKYIIPEKDFYVDDLSSNLKKRFQHTNAFKIHSKFNIQKYLRQQGNYDWLEWVNPSFHDFVYYNFYFDEIKIIENVKEINENPLKILNKEKRLKRMNKFYSNMVMNMSKEFEINMVLIIQRWQFKKNLMIQTKQYTFDYRKMNSPFNYYKCFSNVQNFLDGYMLSFINYEFIVDKNYIRKNFNSMMDSKGKVDFSKSRIKFNHNVVLKIRNHHLKKKFEINQISFLNYFHHNHFKQTFNPENISLTSLDKTLKKVFVIIMEKYQMFYEEDPLDRSVERVLKDIVLKFKINYIPRSIKEGFQDEKTLNEHYFLIEYDSIKMIVKLHKDEYFLTEIIEFSSTPTMYAFLDNINHKYACFGDPFYNIYAPIYLNYHRFQRYSEEFRRVILKCDAFKPNYNYFLISRKLEENSRLKFKSATYKYDYALNKKKLCPWTLNSSIYKIKTLWDFDEDSFRFSEETQSPLKNKSKSIKKIKSINKVNDSLNTESKTNKFHFSQSVSYTTDDIHHFKGDDGIPITFDADFHRPHKKKEFQKSEIKINSNSIEFENIKDSESISNCLSPKGYFILNNRNISVQSVKKIMKLFIVNKNPHAFSTQKKKESIHQDTFMIIKKVTDKDTKESFRSSPLEYKGPDLEVECLTVYMPESRDLYWLVCPLMNSEVHIYNCNKYYQNKFKKVFEISQCMFNSNFVNPQKLLMYHIDYTMNRLIVNCSKFTYLIQKDMGFVEIGRNLEEAPDSHQVEETDKFKINGNLIISLFE
jgi:hypothetical protein